MNELTDIGDEQIADGQAVWNADIAVLTLDIVERTILISKYK